MIPKVISALFNLAAKCAGSGPLGTAAKAAAKNMHLLEGVRELEIIESHLEECLTRYSAAILDAGLDKKGIEEFQSSILKFAAVLKCVGLNELNLEVSGLVISEPEKIMTFIGNYENKVKTSIREKREEVEILLREVHTNLYFNAGRCPR